MASVRYQLVKPLGLIAADLPAEACAGILEKNGRHCACPCQPRGRRARGREASSKVAAESPKDAGDL